MGFRQKMGDSKKRAQGTGLLSLSLLFATENVFPLHFSAGSCNRIHLEIHPDALHPGFFHHFFSRKTKTPTDLEMLSKQFYFDNRNA